MDELLILLLIPLLVGWITDSIFGDPPHLPHPIVWFGKTIAWGEKRLNKGENRVLKGAFFSVGLIVGVLILTFFLLKFAVFVSPFLAALLTSVVVFYCLAGKTLICEVKAVFDAVDISEEAGRVQVARIVGRDTSSLSSQQIRTAALETLAENLSDGVIAPLFWFMFFGAPGMLAYKMINTLDSMIGYKNARYIDFGRWAARIDDVANYIPARLTAIIMLLVSNKLHLMEWVFSQGKRHASPNSGYPEAALAAILNCRFGGPNRYFGQLVEKPHIGTNDKILTTQDMQIATTTNRRSEMVMIALVVMVLFIGYSLA